MYTIRKQFKFEMAHQLKDSYSAACHENLHGHSYVLELFFTTDDLNGDGMVVDFGEVKDVIGRYVDEWDHSLTMPIYFDEEYLNMLRKYTKKFRVTTYNPTAENMAKNMYQNINILLEYTISATCGASSNIDNVSPPKSQIYIHTSCGR